MTSQEELRRLMRLMNPDAEQIEEAAIAAPRVAGTVGAFGSGIMDQLRGLAALPGEALDFGRGTLQKIRELSPEELRGQAPAMDTESVDAFVAAAQRAKEDPKGEAAKALAAISDYLKQGTSSPEAFAQMLGQNVPLPVPSRTRTPPVARMAQEPLLGGPIRQFSGRLDNFVAGLPGPVRKDQFLGQLSNKFRNYEVERARQALAELPDNAKLTPQQLTERLSATLNPGDLTTKIIPPSERGGFYQSYDNPYPDRRLGVIHLNKDIPIAPEILSKAEALEKLQQEPLSKGGPRTLSGMIYDPDPELRQRVLALVRESGAETPVTESTVKELADQLEGFEKLTSSEAMSPITRLSYYKTAVEAPGATERNSDVPRYRPPTEDTPSFWEVQNSLKEGYVEADRAAGVLPDHFGHSKKASRLAKKIVFLDAIDNLIKMAEPVVSTSPRLPLSASKNLEYLKELRAVIQEHPGWVQDPFYNPRASLPTSSQSIFKKREKAVGDAELLVSLDDQLKLDSGGLGASRNSNVYEAFAGLADALIEAEEARPKAVIQSAASTLRGLIKYADEQAPKIYKGQHPALQGGANPVAFSRFSEHTVDIPELGNVKGIYINELQSDLLQDVRERGVKGRTIEMDNAELDQLAKEESALRKRLGSGIRARLFDKDAVVLDEKQRKTLDNDLKQNLARQKVLKGRARKTKLEPKKAYQFFEPFANMETSPQILQQLLIKNTIGAAVQRGDSFVAFPGAQSKQAQLYENLPNNLKQVAKDLGPGFEVRLLTLPDSKGNPFTHPAVIWGPEAAARVVQKGVPFAQGGEVKTLATSPRPY